MPSLVGSEMCIRDRITMDQKRLTSNYPLVRCSMFDFSKNYVGPTLTTFFVMHLTAEKLPPRRSMAYAFSFAKSALASSRQACVWSLRPFPAPPPPPPRRLPPHHHQRMFSSLACLLSRFRACRCATLERAQLVSTLRPQSLSGVWLSASSLWHSD